MPNFLLFENRLLQVFPQENLAAALRRNGVEIATGCNGKNKCGSCKIRLLSGTFFSDGKVFEVTEKEPLELNACSLRQLSATGKACYPSKKRNASSSPCWEPACQELFPGQPTDQTILGIDLGTTNIVFALQRSGKIFTGSQQNAQIKYGDNVIDRIAFASSETSRKQLRRALIEETIQSFLSAVLETPAEISAIAVAGNTAMTHFFFDEDPASLGQAPYLPQKTQFSGTAASTGLDLFLPATPVYAAPCLSAFIGGDISAGLKVTGFGSKDKCELYMDIGTNCEIVLNDHGQYTAISAAAGPAFERCHVRADHVSAVQHIAFSSGSWEYFPSVPNPTGFCGTGLVDLLSAGHRHGFLDRFGKWQKASQLPEKLHISNEILSQLLTAKAAIESCLQLLFQKTQLAPEALERIFLAGSFAENLNLDNGKYLGLLPDIPNGRFHFCGNASLAGTLLLARSPEIQTISLFREIRTIDPAEEPAYPALFSKALCLDHI